MVFSHTFTSCRSSSKKNYKTWQWFDFKDIKFPVITRDILKSEKNILSALVFLAIKIRKNIQSMHQKIVTKKNMLIYYWQKKNAKGTMLVLKVSMRSCMTILYMVEGNIFPVIVYKLSAQKKYLNVILKIALKLMVNKVLRC